MTLHTMKLRCKKAWKSWTINYGLMLLLLGELQSREDVLRDIMKDPASSGLLITGIGIVVVLLRYKTDKPLEEK